MNAFRTFCFFACCAAFCGVSAKPASAADPPSASSSGDRAAALYKQANDLYREKKLVEAEALYLQAWALQRTYDIATNLGAVLLDLKKYREAAEYLAFAQRTFPARGTKEDRETIATRLSLAKAEVVTLRVIVSVQKADVRVNGKAAGVAPLSEDVFAEAGSVVVEASLNGYEAAKETVKAGRGETKEVRLTLVATQAVTSRSMVPSAIGFGVGGAGLVMGAVAAGVAAAKTADLKKVCGEALACPASERGGLDAATTSAHVSTVGFVLAGVGVAAGVTFLFLPLGEKPKAQTALVVGPGFVGVKGAF